MRDPSDLQNVFRDSRTTADADAQRRLRLRSFLRAARERVQPEDHKLPCRRRRRTPGLRREEVAEMAGISTAWYTLLETARNRRVSTRMLDRVARVLRLSDAEKLCLYSLALPEIPSPMWDGEVAADVRDIGRWRTYTRQLREAASPSAIEELTVDFVWTLVGPCELVAFLELDGISAKYRCVRSKSAKTLGGPRSKALPDFDVQFLRSMMRAGTCEEQDGGYCASRVDALDFSGALVYARPARPQSQREREALCLIAELLSLALSKEAFASTPARMA